MNARGGAGTPAEWLGKAAQTAGQWYALAAAALGAGAVVAGAYEPGQLGVIGGLTGLVVLGLGALDAWLRLQGTRSTRPLGAYEGPLLWLVLIWTIMQLGGSHAAHLTPLAAGFLAWQVATFPASVARVVVAAAVLLEVGLTVADRQDSTTLVLHLVVYTAAAVALRFLTEAEAFRRTVDEAASARKVAQSRQEALHDFRLTTQAPSLDALGHSMDDLLAKPTISQATLDFISESFSIQLQFLRETLDLNTAAVLWRKPNEDHLVLRGYATRRDRLEDGPFQLGAGVPGSVMRDGGEVSISPVHGGFNGLPYYANTEGVGAILALPLRDMNDATVVGVLCLDRSSKDGWTDAELRATRLAARKLTMDVSISQERRQAEIDRDMTHRLWAALRHLNKTQTFAEACDAALKAVRLVHPDLAAICLVEGDLLKITHVAGENTQRLLGLTMTTNEGLVGQAIRVREALPVGGVHKPNQAVFTTEERLDEMRSVIVQPLYGEGGANTEALGALVVAAKLEDRFINRLDLLKIIAQLVGVKIELARLHDQIDELATVDGLTGLKNHRVFQQQFDTMLASARRLGHDICFLLTDIDKFKNLNDTYGHPFGDVVLKGVAEVLGSSIRENDLAARYGGEEFALILEGADVEGGRTRAETVRAAIEALEFEHETGPVKVTMSIGLASFPANGDEKTVLIERADVALYQAKRNGRNQVVGWSDLDDAQRSSGDGK